MVARLLDINLDLHCQCCPQKAVRIPYESKYQELQQAQCGHKLSRKQFLPLSQSYATLRCYSKRRNLHILPGLPLRALGNRLWLPNHDMQLNRFRAPSKLDIDLLLKAILFIVCHIGVGARLKVRCSILEVGLIIQLAMLGE